MKGKRMDPVQRLFVVIWMYIAVLTGILVAVLPILVALGSAWAWSGDQPQWSWANVVAPWAARVGACLGLWCGARAASKRFPTVIPAALVISGLTGFAIGVRIGHFLADAWLPDPSLLHEGSDMAGDVVAATALCCFGVAVWGGSFWRSRAGMTV